VKGIVEDVSRLVQEVGLDKVTGEDVREMLVSHRQQLSYEDLEN
jgi:hypothetical protein